MDVDERAAARARTAEVEEARLRRHRLIAHDLLMLPADERDALIEHARGWVQRYRADGLCSRAYVVRWSKILELPAPAIAEAIVSDMDGWGRALRQCSPWVGIHGRHAG